MDVEYGGEDLEGDSNKTRSVWPPDWGPYRRLLLPAALAAILVSAVLWIVFATPFRAGRSDSFEVARRTIFNLAGISVVAGVAAAAIVQILKNLVGVRGLFNERMTAWWTESNAWQPPNKYQRPTLWQVLMNPKVSKPFEELMELMAVRDRRAFFDLPIEQVCGQLAAAADYAVVDRSANSEALIQLLKPESHKQGDKGTDPNAVRAANLHAIQGNIDLLQIDGGYRWKIAIQALAAVSAGLFTVGIVRSADPDAALTGVFLFGAFVGGFASWTVRDLAAVVSRLRQ